MSQEKIKSGVSHTFVAEDVNDLYAYDPTSMSWSNLSATASGAPPSPRDSHGFASAGGRLYVHGGEFCEASCGEAGAALGCRSYCSCCCILSAPSSAAGAR